QIRYAPATSRPRAAALADLAGAARLVNADEIEDFPLGDVEAVADGVVEFQGKKVEKFKSGQKGKAATPQFIITTAFPKTNVRFLSCKLPHWNVNKNGSTIQPHGHNRQHRLFAIHTDAAARGALSSRSGPTGDRGC